MKMHPHRPSPPRSSGYSWKQIAGMCLLLGFTCSALHAGQGLKIFACDPGEGPMLVFVRPENSDGRPLVGSRDDRSENVYVWSAGDSEPPHRVIHCNVPLPHFLHRLSRHEVLIRYDYRLQLLDLKAGKMTQLLKTKDQSDLVRANGNTLVLLQHTVPQESYGYRLETRDGKTVLDGWHRPKDRLLTYFAGEVPKTVELAEPLIEAILHHDAAGFWVVTAETKPRLLHLSPQGKITDELPWHADWAVCEAKFLMSPDARHIAFSILRTDQDFHSCRDLVVMSREKKTIIKTVSDIDMRSSSLMFGSATQSLQLAWLDRSHLQFRLMLGFEGEVLDVETLAVTKSDLKALYPQEPRDKREVVGKFETTFGKVWFGKDTEVAASVLDAKGDWVSSCLEFSPDSSWAALASPDLDCVVVLDGEKRSRRKLIDGWCYDLGWLDAGR